MVRRGRRESTRYLLRGEKGGARHQCGVPLASRGSLSSARWIVGRKLIHVESGIRRIAGLLHLAEVVPLMGGESSRVDTFGVNLAHQVRQVDAWGRREGAQGADCRRLPWH